MLCQTRPNDNSRAGDYWSRDEQELLQRLIPARVEGDAVKFENRRVAKLAGLDEGDERTVVYLRLNTARELVIQRDYLVNGRREHAEIPVRLSYRYWSRAKRLSPGKR
jgi:hypothetical protein